MNLVTRTTVGFGAALAIVVCLAALSYQNILAAEEQRAWVIHTHLVLDGLDHILVDLTDAETGERGFLFAGADVYLEPYRTASIRIPRDLSEVRELTRDNPAQQRSLESLEPAIAAKFAEWQAQIELRRRGAETVDQLLAGGLGKNSMDQLRVQLSEMDTVEQSLLDARSTQALQSSHRTKQVIYGGNFLALVLLMAAGVLVLREIDQRRRVEEEVIRVNAGLEQRIAERTAELAAREKDLARSNAELQQFADVASHDLQEPLRMVASFTQLLAKRYRDQLGDDGRDFIDHAVDGARRMQVLISDLLAYSRVGTQGKALEPVDCQMALQHARKSLKVAMEESGAVITHDPLPWLMADSIQLVRLLQNLLGNAIKFRGAATPTIHISAAENGNIWTISIRDNGIGIATEHCERIFVIFQRLHTRGEYPGTGMGLAICKKIVERHGGHIWCEPAPEGGSVFSFTIPAAPAQIKETKTNMGPRTGIDTPLVEDNPGDLRLDKTIQVFRRSIVQLLDGNPQ